MVRMTLATIAVFSLVGPLFAEEPPALTVEFATVVSTDEDGGIVLEQDLTYEYEVEIPFKVAGGETKIVRERRRRGPRGRIECDSGCWVGADRRELAEEARKAIEPGDLVVVTRGRTLSDLERRFLTGKYLNLVLNAEAVEPSIAEMREQLLSRLRQPNKEANGAPRERLEQLRKLRQSRQLHVVNADERELTKLYEMLIVKGSRDRKESSPPRD